jgi:DNA-binding protein HU-beta
MNKSGLIAEISKRTGTSKAEVGRVIDALIAVVRESVAGGERVSLVGFGTFERKRRNRRIARNPRQPKEPIVVPARDLPWFTPGKEFKDAVESRRSRFAASTARRTA